MRVGRTYTSVGTGLKGGGHQRNKGGGEPTKLLLLLLCAPDSCPHLLHNLGTINGSESSVVEKRLRLLPGLEAMPGVEEERSWTD